MLVLAAGRPRPRPFLFAAFGSTKSESLQQYLHCEMCVSDGFYYKHLFITESGGISMI